MLLAAENFRVGLVTEHIPVKDIASYITKDRILSKLSILHASLKKDFNIERPKIAVLALNPHAGDDGVIGTEEEEIIKPAIKEAKHHNMLVIGPFQRGCFFRERANIISLMQYWQCITTRALFHLNLLHLGKA